MPTEPETTGHGSNFAPKADSAARRASLASRLFYWSSLLFLIAAVSVFVRLGLGLRDFQIDDAFITYRFGDRLAHDATLRWNLASPPADTGLDAETLALLERPVEGYTSFLAVLISTVFIGMGLPPLACWKVFGALLAFATAAAAAWGAMALFQGLGGSRRGGHTMGLLCAGLYLIHPLVALHAMSGMETALFGFLLMGLTALGLRVVFSPEGPPWRLDLMAAGFLLLGMTRPEGVLWSLLATGAMWVGLSQSGTVCNRRRLARAFLLFFVLPGFVYFVWRWTYFSSFLPATFHAKVGAGARPSPLGRLHTYLPSHWAVWQYLRDNWLLLGAALLVGVAGSAWGRMRGSGKSQSPPLPGTSVLALFLLFFASLACIAFFSSVHMLMGFGYRFLFPFGQTFLLTLLVPLVVLCGRLLHARGDTAASDRGPDACTTRRAHGILGVLLLGLMAFGLARTATQVQKHCLDKDYGVYTMVQSNRPSVIGYRNLASELNAVAERVGRQLTLFHHNMGEIMYYAPRWDSVEPVGLVDLGVNRLGYSADYVFARRPDLFILPSKRADAITPYAYTFGHTEIFPDISQALHTDSRMGDYAYLGHYPHGALGSTGRMHLLARRELLDAHPWLQDALVLHLGLRNDLVLSADAE